MMGNRPFLLAALLLTGCSGTVTATLPKVTATQQLLQSLSESRAVASLAINLPRRLTYVDAEFYTGDKYLLGCFIRALLLHGVPITDAKGKASTIAVILSPADSINSKSYYLGTPPIPVNGVLTIPSLSAFSKATAIGISRLQYVAYDRRSGELLGAASSKYGVAEYSVLRSILFGSFDYPHLSNITKGTP